MTCFALKLKTTSLVEKTSICSFQAFRTSWIPTYWVNALWTKRLGKIDKLFQKREATFSRTFFGDVGETQSWKPIEHTVLPQRTWEDDISSVGIQSKGATILVLFLEKRTFEAKYFRSTVHHTSEHGHTLKRVHTSVGFLQFYTLMLTGL